MVVGRRHVSATGRFSFGVAQIPDPARPSLYPAGRYEAGFDDGLVRSNVWLIAPENNQRGGGFIIFLHCQI